MNSRRKFFKSIYLFTSFFLLSLTGFKLRNKNKKYIWYLNNSDK